MTVSGLLVGGNDGLWGLVLSGFEILDSCLRRNDSGRAWVIGSWVADFTDVLHCDETVCGIIG